MVDSADVVEAARRQVAVAHAVMVGHHPAVGGSCSCGRQLPCSVALACIRASEHHSNVLAVLHVTVELPTLTARPSGRLRPG